MSEHPEYPEPNEYVESPSTPEHQQSVNWWTQFIKLFTPSTPAEWRRTVIAGVATCVLMIICSLPGLALNYFLTESLWNFDTWEESLNATATARVKTCFASVNQATNVYTDPDVTSTQITTMYPYGALSEAPIVQRKGMDWVQVRLPSGTLGWAETTTIYQRGGTCSQVPIAP